MQELLKENIGATALELTSNDLREIENATSKMPLQGSDTEWYKNVLKTPTIRLAAR